MGKWIALGVVLLIVLMAGGCALTSYNGLVGSSQAVDAQWGQVENVYQRRADLIPNLVATVKGAAAFEQDTLIAVTQARASVGQVKVDAGEPAERPGRLREVRAGAAGPLGRAAAPHGRGGEVSRAEGQPELPRPAGRSSRARRTASRSSACASTRSRRRYNTQRLRFPTVIFANMMGFGPKAYFKAQVGSDVAPTVDFGKPAPSPAQ